MPLYMQKAIVPTAITSRSMNAYFLNALLRVKENVELDYSATIATWKEKHPTFKVYIKYAGGWARIIGGTSGASLDNKVWNWLDKGTTKRYAVMTDPFHPKTAYRNIGSVAGVGHKAYVMRKTRGKKSKKLIDNYMPGIPEREFTIAIKENNEELLQKEINKAVNNAILKGGGVFRK